MVTVTRRNVIQGAAAAAVAFPMVNFGMYAVHAQAPKKYAKRVVDLVKSSMVIDMLGPLTLNMTPEIFSHRMSDEQTADFLASGINVWHNAAGAGRGAEAYPQVLAYFGSQLGYIARNGHLFTLVDKVDDFEKIKAAGKVAVIQGVQNSEHFRRPEDVKQFYQIGQRVSQLTYNTQNMIGSGCTDRVDGGVSDFGESIIKAMNAVGMLVDVSHCGDRTTLDGIELSPVPIAFTHSNCRALANHPRTKTDEAIKALGKKGGVMGITGVRNFIKVDEPTNIGHMADHIDHVAKLIGPDHVGIGSDADLYGYDDMPPEQYKPLKAAYKGSYAFRDKIDTDGFDSPVKIYNLVEELVRRNWSDDNIRAVLGGNFRRLLAGTWK